MVMRRMFDTIAIGMALTAMQLFHHSGCDQQGDGGRQGEEDDQHAQTAARLDDADAGFVEQDDVAFREGR